MGDFNRALAGFGAVLLAIGILLTGFLMVGTVAAEETFDDDLDLEDGDRLIANATFAENASADLEATVENSSGVELETVNATLDGDANETVEWTYDLDASDFDDLGDNETATAFVVVTADDGVLDSYEIGVDEGGAPTFPISSDDHGMIAGIVLLILAVGLLMKNGNGNGNRRNGGY